MKLLTCRGISLAFGLWCCLPVAGVAHEGVKCSERNLDQAIKALRSRKSVETYFTPYITLTKKDVFWARSENRILGITENESRSEVHAKTLWNGLNMTLMYHEADQMLWVAMEPPRKGRVVPTVVHSKCAMLD